eukprot:TRINITY_DN62387_c0_g1_i1.p1 TRINITY_DN62387_c0_g1~~TRINITY_DN62387_c0_g1_i1.p1  ORF type:complete len:421 (+),score=76.53 TRINITY_DN62387_c0_g1_i1:79-1341(+)
MMHVTSRTRALTTLAVKRGSEWMGLPGMLKPESVDTMAATAGVVAPHALDITKTFYVDILKQHPGLLTYFNPAHNVPNSIHQPAALANSIVAYASNIKDLSPLLVPGGPVDAICHRHCALGVYPEQYGVVHEYLMAAVGKVLGSAVTPEIAAAYSEGVLFLAKVCIDKEESLYQMAEKRKGGWSGFVDMQVSEIKDVAADIKSFSFKPLPGSELAGQGFEFTPGQYISLKIDPNGDGRTAPRHYTATSPPGADFLQCTVKKLPGGKVSSFVHEQLKVGDTVQLSAPFGVFTPEPEATPAVLMSAGIGVTPMVAFDRALGEQVKLKVHVDKAPESHAYRSLFQGQKLEKYSTTGGRTSSQALVTETLDKAGKDNVFYICGPEKWMDEVQAELLMQGASKVKCEVFGSQLGTGCPFMAGAAK